MIGARLAATCSARSGELIAEAVVEVGSDALVALQVFKCVWSVLHCMFASSPSDRVFTDVTRFDEDDD